MHHRRVPFRAWDELDSDQGRADSLPPVVQKHGPRRRKHHHGPRYAHEKELEKGWINAQNVKDVLIPEYDALEDPMCPIKGVPKKKGKSPKGRRRRRDVNRSTNVSAADVNADVLDNAGAVRMTGVSSLPLLRVQSPGKMPAEPFDEVGSVPGTEHLPVISAQSEVNSSQHGPLALATADMIALKKVLTRESMLSSIRSVFNESCRDNGTRHMNEFTLLAISGKMKIFREITVETAEAIAVWKEKNSMDGSQEGVYCYKGDNYLAKMIVDLDFLSKSDMLVKHWGFPLQSNPLLLSESVRETLINSEGSTAMFQHVDGIDVSRVRKALVLIMGEKNVKVNVDDGLNSDARPLSKDVGPEYSPSAQQKSYDDIQSLNFEKVAPAPFYIPQEEVNNEKQRTESKRRQKSKKQASLSPSRRRKQKKSRKKKIMTTQSQSEIWRPSDRVVAHANDKADRSWMASNRLDKGSAGALKLIQKIPRKSDRVASHIVPKGDIHSKLAKMKKDISLSKVELEQKQEELDKLKNSRCEFVSSVRDWKAAQENDTELERVEEVAREILFAIDPELACRTFAEKKDSLVSEPTPLLIRDWNLTPEQYEQREILYEMFATDGLTRKRAKKIIKACSENITKREREIWLRNEELQRKEKVCEYNVRFLEREAKRNEQKLKEKAGQDQAAIKIQTLAKKHGMKRRVEDRRIQREGALKIQKCSRARASRKRVQEKRMEKTAAVKIQARARGNLERRYLNAIGERNTAALSVQNQVRRRQAKKSVGDIRTRKNKAAVRIQNHARGKQAKVEVQRLKDEHFAALTIQGGVRHVNAKARVHQRRRERSAVKIQGKARRKFANERVSMMREKRQLEMNVNAQSMAREYVMSISMQAVEHILESQRQCKLGEIKAFVTALLDRSIQSMSEQIVNLARCRTNDSISMNTFATEYICKIIQSTLAVYDQPVPNQNMSSTGIKNCVGCKLRNGAFALLVVNRSHLTKDLKSYNIFKISGLLLSGDGHNSMLEPTSLSEDEVNAALELGGFPKIDFSISHPIGVAKIETIARSCAIQMEVALFRDDTRSRNLQTLVFHSSFVSYFNSYIANFESRGASTKDTIHANIGCRIGSGHFILLSGSLSVIEVKSNPECVSSLQLGGLVLSGDGLRGCRLEPNTFSMYQFGEALRNSSRLQTACANLNSSKHPSEALQCVIRECAPTLALTSKEESGLLRLELCMEKGQRGCGMGCRIGSGEFVLLRGMLVQKNLPEGQCVRKLSIGGILLSGNESFAEQSLQSCNLSLEEVQVLCPFLKKEAALLFADDTLGKSASELLQILIRSCAAALVLDEVGPRLVSCWSPTFVPGGKIYKKTPDNAVPNIYGKDCQIEGASTVDAQHETKCATVIQSKQRQRRALKLVDKLRADENVNFVQSMMGTRKKVHPGRFQIGCRIKDGNFVLIRAVHMPESACIKLNGMLLSDGQGRTENIKECCISEGDVNLSLVSHERSQVNLASPHALNVQALEDIVRICVSEMQLVLNDKGKALALRGTCICELRANSERCQTGCKTKDGKFVLIYAAHMPESACIKLGGIIFSGGQWGAEQIQESYISEGDVNLALGFQGQGEVDLASPHVFDTQSLEKITRVCVSEMVLVMQGKDKTLGFAYTFATQSTSIEKSSQIGCKLLSGELVLLRGLVIPRDSSPGSVPCLLLNGMVVSGMDEGIKGCKLEPLIMPFGECVTCGGLNATAWSKPGASSKDIQSSLRILARVLRLCRRSEGKLEVATLSRPTPQWKISLTYV